MEARRIRLWAACIAIASCLLTAPAFARTALLFYDAKAAPVAFAAGELDAALQARGHEAAHRPLAQAFDAQPVSGPTPDLRVTFLSREEALRRGPAEPARAREVRALRAEGR